MKTTKCFITITLLILSITQSKSENIFSVNASQEVVIQPQYIDSFFWISQGDPYTQINTSQVVTGNLQYLINLYNYNGFIGDSGYFRIIEIKSSTGKVLLTLNQTNGWDKIYTPFRSSINDYYLSIPLANNRLALVFTGWPYGGTPELLTIIVIQNNTATLVFNKNYTISSMTNNDSTFSMIVQDDIVEYRNGVACGSPNSFRIYKDGGILKIENQ